ncbi:DUF4381 domain-containing protein [Rhizobium sp. Root1220]|uniref:DUF4381 domain-containing protein n=1 Tax=Rhizobium sp. Root1220 TaxID=1736432 RepID=UPI0006F66FB7|nr:DUF4381 domain-containing protein [Rhizobium sp. Root1220]KQV81931.1 hypothetical protein ASC90_24460 [Rhizobium sp. Root1220]
MDGAPKLDPLTETALRSMHDVVLPQAVSWIPQTWGWAVVAAFLLATLAGWAFFTMRRYHRNAYRREALRLLDAVAEEMKHPATRVAGVHRLAELLKRTALAAWPREQVASLSETGWNDLVSTSFDGGEGKALQRLLDDFEYHEDKAVVVMPANVGEDLVESSRRWIKKHDVRA